MLYQKSRPQKLSEIVGNEFAVRGLASTLRSLDHPHVFLLIGPSGTGKTTLARIVASEVGATDTNIVEINAANTRGIDTVRELELQSRYSPFNSSTRVIIMDECHQLTVQAMNSLLKLLEDVPSYQYYILCSTDPERIIKTIRNRCTIYETKLLSDAQIIVVIQSACNRVSIPLLDIDKLEIAVEMANGCPRRALVLAEQLADADLNELELSDIKETKAEIILLCRTLLNTKHKWDTLVDAVKELEPLDYEAARRVIMGYLTACVLGSKEGNLSKMLLAVKSFTDSQPLNSNDKPKFIAMLAEAYLQLRN